MKNDMKWYAQWIKPRKDMGDVVPLFQKTFTKTKEIKKATLYMTALGVYEAHLNGKQIGSYCMTPGWTSYEKRLQYQTYDLTDALLNSNQLNVFVGKGWYRSRLVGWQASGKQDLLRKNPAGLLAQLELEYTDQSKEWILSDDTWTVQESATRFSEIYDGECYDACFKTNEIQPVVIFQGPTETLLPQQGEYVKKQETFYAASLFETPAGEMVLDFGQELTGVVALSVTAKAGEIIDLSFGEVLDAQGNFYTENYRTAKSQYHYICKDGEQTWHPHFTFYGFRYIRINDYPGGLTNVTKDSFHAIALYSDMKRTGWIETSNPLLNQLFHNCIWGQKGNFLDVPTDCPQRDERLGWTGDAQVFIKTACLNYNAKRFYEKWLADMAADQKESGYIGHVVPDLLDAPDASAAWGDAATICPWELYLAYGDQQILADQFNCMKRWVDYITTSTTTPALWTGGTHYGDWLGLDAPSGSYKGSTREDFIASAFYARSTALVIKAGEVLQINTDSYKELYGQIVNAFQKTYSDYQTQTEYALAIYFDLATDCQKASDQLAEKIRNEGNKLQTGFVGTPYLLYALSIYGHATLAYDLLLRRTYPSWLYPITKGATTIWEHWDGIKEDGSFWSSDMNSFNHYAYGAVIDWIYTEAAGIHTVESAPGYQKVRISPIPDSRLEWLSVKLDTQYGQIQSSWKKCGEQWQYTITVPVDAQIILDEEVHTVAPGTYYFYKERT